VLLQKADQHVLLAGDRVHVGIGGAVPTRT